MAARDPFDAAGTGASKRRFGPRAIAVGAVLLLHVALITWLQHAWHRADSHQAQRRSSIRMVTIQLPPLPKQATTKTPAPTPVATTSNRRASPDPRLPTPGEAPTTRTSARVPAPRPDVDREEEAPRSTVVIAAPAPASAASGPTGRDLLYGAATQRAIRQSTQGQPLLAERADTASLAPDKIDASTKLGNEMMKGASGDCLKGEFAGGGAGLLSLPFWVLAEARGKCRR